MLIRLRDGLRLHARDRGRGPPVIALHGFAGPSDAWDASVAGLSMTHRVIALDLLGHGASDGAVNPDRYAVDQAIEDVVDVMDAFDVEHAALLGYSMGGRVALAVACRAPERVTAVALEGASPGMRSDVEQAERRLADEQLAGEIVANGTEWFADHWTELPLFESRGRLSPDVLAAVRQRLLANRPRYLAACLRGLGVGNQPSFWDDLARLAVPTMLLVGADDAKFVDVARQMHQLLPVAELALVPDAGHSVHLEQPAQWHAAVRGFLERNVPSD